MKTQKEIGKVYLKTDGLDVERFCNLISDFEVYCNRSAFIELKEGNYIGNYYSETNKKFEISSFITNSNFIDYKLIKIDELDDLINGNNSNYLTYNKNKMENTMEKKDVLNVINTLTSTLVANVDGNRVTSLEEAKVIIDKIMEYVNKL